MEGIDLKGNMAKYPEGRNKVNAEWITPSGMQYPKPKDRKELMQHPKKPSESRVEDLKEPYPEQVSQSVVLRPSVCSTTRYFDILNHILTTLYRNVSFDLYWFIQSAVRAEPVDADTMLLERGFITQLPNGELFGKLNPPKYAHEFLLSKVGDKQTLPRGLQVGGGAGDKDAAFFGSVFCGGEKAAKMMKEAEEREKKEWLDKVVVDSLSFKIGGFLVKDKASQIDRYTDILKDPPNRIALNHLRTRKSQGGKDYGLSQIPLSTVNTGEFVQNEAANVLLRKTDKTKFMSTAILRETHPDIDSVGKKLVGSDFVRYIHDQDRVPKSQKLIARRSIPAQTRDMPECRGPLWDYAGDK